MDPGLGFKSKLLLTWVLLTAAPHLHASALFEDDAPLEIGLSGPVDILVSGKEERIELPFTLQIDDREIELLVRSRGKSRMRVCDFPPLRLNFEKAETAGTPFEGQGKLKLVVNCHKGERADLDVLEEYAAYRIFALLSDVSYRVRLVKLTFKDTDDQPPQGFRQSYGFLIEPLEQLAARVGGSVSAVPAVALKWMDAGQASLVYVFQYLVANTDWSFVAPDEEASCCHNIHMVDVNEKLFPVPYDFDLAGLVNASYAAPDASLHIKQVTRRVYRGFCTDEQVLREAVATVVSRQEEILDVIRSLPIDSDKARADRIKYLQKFFDEASDGNRLISKFEKSCLS